MKELINNYQDKKGFWRKARRATAIAGALVALSACEQPQIKDGTVYQKEYIKEQSTLVGGKYPTSRQEIDREVVSMPSIHEEIGVFDKETISKVFHLSTEKWKIYIAQCPTKELPSPEKIKKECKTESFDVPQEVYPKYKLGEHANFKQPK